MKFFSKNFYTKSEFITHYFVRIFSFFVLFFLITPILIAIPLSFNAEPFFTFTEGMLRFDKDAYSLKWYIDFFNDDRWILAVKNSFMIGIGATLVATILGTIAALGLQQKDMPMKSFITALLISPMIVPLIIIAAGMFFFYSDIGLSHNIFGIIVAHAALGIPFVVITVTSTLVGFDKSLYNAALSLGVNPFQAFRQVTFPLIRPGIISGALFAFVTSFDEVVLVLFLAGPEQVTIPREMFSGLREQINPTILAVATLLVIISALMLLAMELLRRRTQRITLSSSL